MRFIAMAAMRLQGVRHPALAALSVTLATIISWTTVIFIYSTQAPDLSHAARISPLAIVSSLVPVTVLVSALLTAVVDRLQKHFVRVFGHHPWGGRSCRLPASQKGRLRRSQTAGPQGSVGRIPENA